MNIMVKEQFVTRITAEMLKKAGFDAPCRTSVFDYLGTAHTSGSPRNYNADDGFTSVPTQALAMRWLREVHDIQIWADSVDLGNPGVVWIGHRTRIHTDSYIFGTGPCETYEEAIETAIRDAVREIIGNDDKEERFV